MTGIRFWAGLASVVLVNIVLSGDNALVIAMAARGLPPRQRRWAMIAGGAAAIILRVLFTALAALLLTIPLLEAGGGLVLTGIAAKLLREEEGTQVVDTAGSFLSAVQTITLADVVMSLDNMLAVAGAAQGSLLLLGLGLLLSMPPILIGSDVLARLLNRLPWLVAVGAILLTITGARMVANDPLVAARVPDPLATPFLIGVAVGLTALAFVPATWRWWRQRRTATRAISHQAPSHD